MNQGGASAAHTHQLRVARHMWIWPWPSKNDEDDKGDRRAPGRVVIKGKLPRTGRGLGQSGTLLAEEQIGRNFYLR